MQCKKKKLLYTTIVHFQVTAHEEEVIVDEMCGLAVLRGADVFAPGVLGLQPGLKAGTEVSERFP